MHVRGSFGKEWVTLEARKNDLGTLVEPGNAAVATRSRRETRQAAQGVGNRGGQRGLLFALLGVWEARGREGRSPGSLQRVREGGRPGNSQRDREGRRESRELTKGDGWSPWTS